MLIIDDVDDLEDLVDESDDQDFELPVAPVRKKRRKKRHASETGQLWHDLSTNETLQGALHAVFGTAVGLLTFSVFCGFALMQMCAANWFGRPSYFVHMGILCSGFAMILLCYIGALIDATKSNPLNVLAFFSPNLPVIVLCVLFQERYQQHRRYLAVAAVWTAMMFLSNSVVQPRIGWQQYKNNAEDWWHDRIPANPAAALPAPVAFPQPVSSPVANQPATPVPQQLPPTAAGTPQANRPFQRGQMVLSTNILNYQGSKDAQQAAQEALRPFGWIDADNVQVDLQTKKINMPCRGGIIQGVEVRKALEQAGFQVQGQSMRTVQ
ncbi:MAG: hypothetical protein V4719_02780 [Planctomycetota bacterium]